MSLAQVDFLRQTGVKIGSGVYIDAEWAGEPGVTYADGSSADRGSIVYGHMLAFNGVDNLLQFGKVHIGTNAQVGARSAILPGVNVSFQDSVKAGEMRMAL